MVPAFASKLAHLEEIRRQTSQCSTTIADRAVTPEIMADIRSKISPALSSGETCMTCTAPDTLPFQALNWFLAPRLLLLITHSMVWAFLWTGNLLVKYPTTRSMIPSEALRSIWGQ